MQKQTSKRPSRPFRLTRSNLRLLILAYLGVGALLAVCVFVGIFLLLGNSSNQGQAAARPTARATVPLAATTPTAIVTGAPQGATAAPTQPMLQDDGKFALGGQLPAYQIMSHEDMMRSAGMSWVKFQIVWTEGAKATDARALIDFGHQKGFKVLVSVKGPSNPTSIDYADYLRFVNVLVSNKPEAVEIWNEMNLPIEWPAGQFSASTYVNSMLKPAYQEIKAKSPNTMVITGALAPTGVNDGIHAVEDREYVQGMYAAGAAQYADCIGVHHNAGTTSPSATTGHVSDQGDHHYSWYFLPTLDVYRNGFNGQLPLCITEFGYLSPDGYGPLPAAFAWGTNTTVAEQSAWLAEGVTLAKQLGYVRLVIIWNVDFPADDYSTDPKAGFAIVRPDGTCPACQGLWNAMTAK